MSRAVFGILLISGVTLADARTPAHAEFRVCNQTINLINIAVGLPRDGVFKIEGWWTVPANSCITPVKEDLKSQYVYIHALAVTGEDLLKGEWDMCIKPEKFTYTRIGDEEWNCWAKGYQKAKFAEVDTGEMAKSWTVFIQQQRPGS
jgi:uncharacterized membrane protein